MNNNINNDTDGIVNSHSVSGEYNYSNIKDHRQTFHIYLTELSAPGKSSSST